MRPMFLVLSRLVLSRFSAERSLLSGIRSKSRFVDNFLLTPRRTMTSTDCERLPDPIKSPNDKRLYRAIRLKNGLRALLVTDSEPVEDQTVNPNEAVVAAEDTSDSDEGVEDDVDEDNDLENDEDHEGEPCEQKEKMAAASLCVDVGSFSDPLELSGLAHYLEHMLFMGSEKYPDENAFDCFIKKHGGYDNAHTECETTQYLFEITTKNFRNALDIFAQFFIAPLMKKDSMDRELEAVDSEFQLVFPSDTVRKMLLFQSLAKDGNPLSFFGWGNSESLKTTPESQGIDVHGKVREFYEKHYSSHLMTLCVLSRESLDTLQDWVVEIFGDIPKKEISSPTFKGYEEPFKTPKFCQLYRISPIKKIHQLSVSWSLPSLVKHYKIKPLGYIGWLVGHEGDGSILEYLRKRVWAVSLEGGNDESESDHNRLTSVFAVTVTLSDSGFEHVEDILLAIFQYLDMLRRNGPQKRIYDELQMLDEINFRWKDETDAIEYVENLSKSMKLYEAEDVITGDQLMEHFDENLIRNCLEALQPDNCNIMIMSSNYKKDAPCDQTEKWMQTSYSQEAIPAEWIELWKNPPSNLELHLPDPNKFIATDFDIKMTEDNDNKEIPVALKQNDLMTVWYKKDLKFHAPKGCIYAIFKSPLITCSPQNAVLLDLFIYQLKENLNSEAYSAQMASLEYDIYREDLGLVWKLSGFNHKLTVLLSTILDGVVAFDLNEDTFRGLKIQFAKTYYNEFLKPRNLGQQLRLSVLQHHYWTKVERRTMLEKITLQSVKSFYQQFISHLFVEVMVHGNFTPQEALEIGQLFEKKLQFNALLPEMIPQLRTMQIPSGERTLRVKSFNKDDCNSSVSNYYQLAPGTIYSSSLLDLLLDIMGEPCFDILRTKEQLGYHVGCTTRDTFGILGFIIMVNSPADKFSCSHLDNRIESFLECFRKQIESLSDEEFQAHVSSLIKTKNCADLNMVQEANRNWSEIKSSCHVFDRVKRETECLQKLRLSEFQEWSGKVLEKNTFKKLSIQVVGFGEKALSECVPLESKETNSRNDFTVTEKSDVYKLSYLGSNVNDKNENFIQKIASFKNELSVYSVCKIVQ